MIPLLQPSRQRSKLDFRWVIEKERSLVIQLKIIWLIIISIQIVNQLVLEGFESFYRFVTES